jgi:hypothetical protein
MLGGSNKSADPSQSFNKLAPLILNLITNTIGKGVDTVIGATKPSEATVTYFKAIGAGLTSMIWTPTDGVLSVTGKTRTSTLALGFERLIAVKDPITMITSSPTISTQVSITLLTFPSISRSEYLISETFSGNQAILPDGSEDGQTKQIILGQGYDVFVKGSFSNSIATGYFLREPGNCLSVVWCQMEGFWLLLNQAAYSRPLIQS